MAPNYAVVLIPSAARDPYSQLNPQACEKIVGSAFTVARDQITQTGRFLNVIGLNLSALLCLAKNGRPVFAKIFAAAFGRISGIRAFKPLPENLVEGFRVQLVF